MLTVPKKLKKPRGFRTLSGFEAKASLILKITQSA